MSLDSRFQFIAMLTNGMAIHSSEPWNARIYTNDKAHIETRFRPFRRTASTSPIVKDGSGMLDRSIRRILLPFRKIGSIRQPWINTTTLPIIIN